MQYPYKRPQRAPRPQRLAGLLLASSIGFAARAGEPEPRGGAPVWRETGGAVSELASIDRLLRDFMVPRKISRGALALVRGGRLVLARGYTWAPEDQPVTQPDSLFRIASLSKPITAAAVLRLVEDGKLRLDDRIVEVLDLEGAGMPSISDPRLRDVTIRQTLQHLGGWDRDIAFDPMFQDRRISRSLGVPRPISTEHIIRFMLGQPLQHDPGTKYAYSNFGYCLLGRVIERRGGMPYGRFVRERVLAPVGITAPRLGGSRIEDRAAGEVTYDAELGSPYGTFRLENMDSHGGWIASAIDMARFVAALDDPAACPILSRASVEAMLALPENLPAERYQRGEAYYGCGWSVRDFGEGRRSFWHTGSLPGSWTFLARWRNGWCCAVLFNRRTPDSDRIDPLLGEALRELDPAPSGPAGTADGASR